MITKDNYYSNTYAAWRIIDRYKSNPETIWKKLVNTYGESYVSASGSRYIYTSKGVYRYSDHFNEVASCYWVLQRRSKALLQKKYLYKFSNHGRSLNVITYPWTWSDVTIPMKIVTFCEFKDFKKLTEKIYLKYHLYNTYKL